MTQHQKSANIENNDSTLPGRYIVDLQFDDFDNFTDTVRDWNIDFQQLDRGQFRGNLLQARSGAVHFGYAGLSRNLHQQGESPPGIRTLVIPATSTQHFCWRGHEITGNSIAIFPKSCELEAVSKDGFQIFTISVPEVELLSVDRLLDQSDVEKIMKETEVLTVTNAAMNGFRSYLEQLKKQLTDNFLQPHNMNLSEELESNLLKRLVTTLSSNQIVAAPPPCRLRDKALKKALEYIAEFGHEPLKINDLCMVTGASERTLRYAFLERFGVSPKTYLIAYRLNKVKKELRHPDSQVPVISDVANRWGFWHMGQFAADYRKLFGELPSETAAGKNN